MKRINKENNFLITWLICIMMMIGACNLGFFKGTWSAFGNVTGQLTAAYMIDYYSNYPSELELESEKKIEIAMSNAYSIMINSFAADGYEFVNWNTAVDGTGDVYAAGEDVTLETNLTLYAQWKKIELLVSYGDVNLDSVINENDYLLIEEHISSINELTGQALINADVNIDGKIDLVDIDIIKQVCLGTEGYIGMLPNNPVLVYEIYIDKITSDNDENLENKEDDESQNSFDNGSSNENTDNENVGTSGVGGNGNGSSSSGSGTSSGKKPNSGNSAQKPSSGNVDGSSNSEQDDSLSQENNNTSMDDDVDQDNNLVQNEEIKENNFSSDDKSNNQKYSLYGSIIVICIFIIAIRLIVYVIYKFKNSEHSDQI